LFPINLLLGGTNKGTKGSLLTHYSLIACLHDQNESAFLESRLFPATGNQDFLKTFQIVLIGWIKSGMSVGSRGQGGGIPPGFSYMVQI